MMTKTIILRTMFLAYVVLISPVSMSESDPVTETSMITGFTTDLIHRDSPQSPSYDPSLSPSQRLVNALARSYTRAHLLKAKRAKYAPQPDVIPTSGEYMMKYAVGTPPVPSIGIADTGSDLTWTQCQPCLICFKQSVPIFSPKKSSTYRRIPCHSANCQSLNETYCSKRRKNCLYSETYGDGSGSSGELAMDTFTLASNGGKSLSIPNIVFGCGFSNHGIFSGSESGIVGLGGGKTSLVRELGPLAHGKFSYCLIPLSDTATSSSKLHFGSNAEITGRGVDSIPLVRKDPETYYYVTLKGISIGDEYYDAGNSEEGNMIVDSGTTLTFLPSALYSKVEKAVTSSIKLRRIKDPTGTTSLCFLSRKDVKLPIPKMTVRFEGGDLRLKQDNVFVRTSNVSLCLAAAPTDDLAIYGNIAQINFLVGYDLVNRTVSFKPADCGK